MLGATAVDPGPNKQAMTRDEAVGDRVALGRFVDGPARWHLTAKAWLMFRRARGPH
jgi:hypothetical protein